MLLVDYSSEYQEKLLSFLDAGYKSVGYTGLELDDLDNDLLNIATIYAFPSCFKLLFNPDGQIIATVAVKIQGQEAELKRVFVDPLARRQGLGKKLSEFAFEYARSQGAMVMHIWSGTLCTVAHQLYKNLDTVFDGTQRFIGGQDDCYEYYFRKDLGKLPML